MFELKNSQSCVTLKSKTGMIKNHIYAFATSWRELSRFCYYAILLLPSQVTLLNYLSQVYNYYSQNGTAIAIAIHRSELLFSKSDRSCDMRFFNHSKKISGNEISLITSGRSFSQCTIGIGLGNPTYKIRLKLVKYFLRYMDFTWRWAMPHPLLTFYTCSYKALFYHPGCVI